MLTVKLHFHHPFDTHTVFFLLIFHTFHHNKRGFFVCTIVRWITVFFSRLNRANLLKSVNFVVIIGQYRHIDNLSYVLINCYGIALPIDKNINSNIIHRYSVISWFINYSLLLPFFFALFSISPLRSPIVCCLSRKRVNIAHIDSALNTISTIQFEFNIPVSSNVFFLQKKNFFSHFRVFCTFFRVFVVVIFSKLINLFPSTFSNLCPSNIFQFSNLLPEIFSISLQICTLLYIAHIIIHIMWKYKIDPDNSAIPFLTALGDLFGSCLLAVAFAFMMSIGQPYDGSAIIPHNETAT